MLLTNHLVEARGPDTIGERLRRRLFLWELSFRMRLCASCFDAIIKSFARQGGAIVDLVIAASIQSDRRLNGLPSFRFGLIKRCNPAGVAKPTVGLVDVACVGRFFRVCAPSAVV